MAGSTFGGICNKLSDSLSLQCLTFRAQDTISAVTSADAAETLKHFPDDSFNIAVTSPPYYRARDYGFDGQIGHEDTDEE